MNTSASNITFFLNYIENLQNDFHGLLKWDPYQKRHLGVCTRLFVCSMNRDEYKWKPLCKFPKGDVRKRIIKNLNLCCHFEIIIICEYFGARKGLKVEEFMHLF